MTMFSERCRERGVRTLATFGDSITAAAHISDPADRWSNRLAAEIGAALQNKGISGTVLQHSPDASGGPRAENGRDRYRGDLLGDDRAEAVAILYGLNDSRYTAAPTTLNAAGFERDYRAVLSGLFGAGFQPDAIAIGSPPYLPDSGIAVGAEDGFGGQARDELDRYPEIVAGIARDTGVFYAAVNENMRVEGADALILPDHVHPNPTGHASIARSFAAARRLETK